ncbi:MAG: BrnA antitoxin family protein [Pseudomonas sp.]
MSKRPNPELIDAENPEWTSDDFKRAVRVDALPASLRGKLMGRPKAATTKQSVTVRYDPEIIAAFKARGPGWQSRMNDALRDWLRQHP